MWSGITEDIQTGWALCDGTNGTPDLRDRFIVGASLDEGGIVQTTIKGSNSPQQTGGLHEVTLTEAQMPMHNHLINGSNQMGCATPSVVQGHNHNLDIGPTYDAGGSLPHENLTPFYALAYLMKL